MYKRYVLCCCTQNEEYFLCGSFYFTIHRLVAPWYYYVLRWGTKLENFQPRFYPEPFSHGYTASGINEVRFEIQRRLDL